MKRPSAETHSYVLDRIFHRGMWIPKKEIEDWEGHFGGKLLKDEKLEVALEDAAKNYVAKTGKHPEMLKIREMPFSYYFPVLVMAELFGMGKNLPTNKYIFIERKRQW